MKLSRETILRDPIWRRAALTFIALVAVEAGVIAGAAGVLQLIVS